MKFFLSMFLFFMLGMTTMADDFVLPKQTIVHDEKIPLGELVTLDVSKITEKIPYLEKVVVDWKVYDNGTWKKIQFGRGDEIFFGAGVKDKKILAFASISYLYIQKDDKGNIVKIEVKSQLISATIAIGSPDPNPNPNPEPDPTFPDGQYGLAKLAYQTTKTLNVPSKAAAAKALATAFDGVASSINADAIKDMETALKTITDKASEALSTVDKNTKDWEPWDSVINEAVYQLYSGKKINNAKDLAVAFQEIAIGLRGVK